MKIVFAGTPEFAVPALQALVNSAHECAAVYTQPDRPAGRGRSLRASPVKELALASKLEVRQPDTLRSMEEQEVLAAIQPDLMVVVAYGLILPVEVLAIPVRGCVNLHASLLPRWRGAAPIQSAILSGDAETGISLMQMDKGLDTGDVIAEVASPIRVTDTASVLHDRLAVLGAELLQANLTAILEGKINSTPQGEDKATYAGKISKRDAVLDWDLDATELSRKVRAYNAWPVAFTLFQDQPLRIWNAEVVDTQAAKQPGVVIEAGAAGVDVCCGKGVLRLREVQLPGGRRISASDFANGHALQGVRFSADPG